MRSRIVSPSSNSMSWLMASLSLLLLLLLPVESSLRGTSSTAAVRVELYDEALCNGCQQFVLEQLRPVYETLGSTVIDLQIVAFGNAQIGDAADPASLQCQHNDAECDANSYLQCAAALYPTAPRHFPFVTCLYEELTMGSRHEPFPLSIFADCARRSALDWASLQNCHDDPNMAWQLQLDAMSKTPKDHTYVPWIVVEGTHYDLDSDDAADFLQVVCAAYQAKGGSPLPAACPATAVAVQDVGGTAVVMDDGVYSLPVSPQ